MATTETTGGVITLRPSDKIFGKLSRKQRAALNHAMALSVCASRRHIEIVSYHTDTTLRLPRAHLAALIGVLTNLRQEK